MSKTEDILLRLDPNKFKIKKNSVQDGNKFTKNSKKPTENTTVDKTTAIPNTTIAPDVLKLLEQCYFICKNYKYKNLSDLNFFLIGVFSAYWGGGGKI